MEERHSVETHLNELLCKWRRILRLEESWDVTLEIVMDSSFHKTGDFKVDCTDKKAILLLNGANPKQENLEEVIVHELLHLKLYPLDQVTESLITANYEEGSGAYSFAYTQFMVTLEVTVEELAKCFLKQYGEDREISYGRCHTMKSYDELFEGLKPLE